MALLVKKKLNNIGTKISVSGSYRNYSCFGSNPFTPFSSCLQKSIKDAIITVIIVTSLLYYVDCGALYVEKSGFFRKFFLKRCFSPPFWGEVFVLSQYGLSTKCGFQARVTFCAGPAPPLVEKISQMCSRQQNEINSLRFVRTVCLPLIRLSSRKLKS